ncbi:MAG TPA: superoxide dismutase family protein [Dongiaceae bacterium]|nr:superoxide dismutase family protein [Dongiaceae bacterium]
MRKMQFILSAALLAAVAATSAVSVAAPAPKPVMVEIKDANGKNIGTATLTEASPKGVNIKLDIRSLQPGEHSIHIHQFAKCEGPDFKSAGPHFAGASGMHDHSAAMPGDIPNFSLVVSADGTAHVSVVAPNLTLGTGNNSVFSNGGTSIVIHAVAGGTDTGAPARIACGVIAKP